MPLKQREFDLYILVPVLFLMCLGIIMVFSASGVFAYQVFHNEYYFLKRQFFFVSIGLVTIYLVSRIPTAFFYKGRYIWLFVSFVLLVLTLTGLGKRAGGAARWLPFFGFSLQPLEFAKVALVIYFAWFFGEKQENIKRFSIGFLPPILVTSTFALLLIKQPDFGGAVFITGIFFLMSFIGGTRILYLISSFLLFSLSAVFMVFTSPYRLKRWEGFLHPFTHAKTSGYQIVQSIYGLAHGGISGVGIGLGKQKLFYLPEAHTDFIVSVLGEEVGFIGLSLLFLALLCFLIRATQISGRCSDLRDKFLIMGMALLIVLGGVLNIAVVEGMLPPKGIAMPFVSYGGSSLISLCIGVGLILGISKRYNRTH